MILRIDGSHGDVPFLESCTIDMLCNASHCSHRLLVHQGGRGISFLHRPSHIGHATIGLRCRQDTKTNEYIRAYIPFEVLTIALYIPSIQLLEDLSEPSHLYILSSIIHVDNGSNRDGPLPPPNIPSCVKLATR
jgi:hypothetical protein